MLSPDLLATLQNVKNGRQVSSDVNRILASDSPTVTKSQRFAFCKALLDSALRNPTGPSALYFSPTIACLRDLAPSLRASDGSTIDVVARVEKYTIKLATSTCETNHQVIRECLFHELQNTLRLLFTQRALVASESLSKHSKFRMKPHERSKQLLDHKENKDPQARTSSSKSRRASGRLQPVEVSNVLDSILFPGASELASTALLPDRDSALVSRVIAGALAIRLTSDLLNVETGERIYVMSAVAIPWIRHLQTFREPSSDSSFYRDRMCMYLDNVQLSCSCPLKKARALSLASSLRGSPPEVYTYELYNSALRAIESSKQGLMQQETIDVVVTIYEDGLQYVSSLPKTEVNWAHEDLSIWFDHVLHVNSRINAKSLPDLFSIRIDAAKSNKKISRDLVKCFEAQLDLYNIGAYSRKTLQSSDTNSIKPRETIWKEIHRCILRTKTPDLFVVRVRWSPEDVSVDVDNPQEKLATYLRFLHVIEPIRSMLVGNSESSPIDASEIIFRRHISATLSSLQLLATNSESFLSATQRKRAIRRIGKMAHGALEAAHILLNLYWRKRESEMLCNVVSSVSRILHYHAIFYESFYLQFWEWFLNWIQTFCEKTRKAIEIADQAVRVRDEIMLIEFLEHCEYIIVNNCKELHSCRMSILRTLRRLHVSRADWLGVYEISLTRLSIEHSTSVERKLGLYQTIRPFLQDLVRAANVSGSENGGVPDFDFRLDSTTPREFILGLLLEFQCYVRMNRSLYRTEEDFHGTIHGLQRGRYLLLKGMPNTEQCLVHQFHQLWVSYVILGGEVWASKTAKSLQRLLRSGTQKKCKGHPKTDAFGFKSGLPFCTPLLSRYVSAIIDIWQCIEEKRFIDITDSFDDLEALQTNESLTPLSRDFLLVSAEILDWASYVLALRDYDLHALRARRSAEDFRETAEIPRSNNLFLRDLCGRVASSTLYDWYLTAHGDNDWSPELKDARLKFSEWNFPDVLGVINGVENELQPYEKALAHEFGSGNITSALLHSHSALKGIVKRMAVAFSKKTKSTDPNQLEFHLGGAKINIGADIRTEAGQELMRELLDLINTLFQHARLNFEAENISLGQYYMERSHSLASECLPEQNYVRSSISAAYNARVGDNPVILLKETVDALDEKSDHGEHSRNLVSEHEMWNQLTVSRYRHGQVASNDDILRAFEIRENAVETKEIASGEWAKRAKTELSVLKAIAFSNIGEPEKAVNIMRPLMDRFPALRVSFRVFAHYHMSRSLWTLQQSEKVPTKTTRKRITRSRAKVSTKKDIKVDADKAIEQTLRQVIPDFNVPWICRRVYGLQSLKIKNGENYNCASDVALLSKRIGVSFNVRWRVSMLNKMELHIQQGAMSEATRLQNLEELFRDMSIGELERLIQMLQKSKCTVIGIDLDDSQECLIIWRICGNGTFLEKKPLPKHGTRSIDGILDRIASIVNVKPKLPASPEKLTNKMKSEWWEDRFKLDDELGEIVSEIESEWIGNASYLFDPFVDGDDWDEECTIDENADLAHVVLLLNTKLERIPWESVGLLRERVANVTRSPSLAFLEHHLRSPMTPIDPRDMFYLVNPTGEFNKTESRFRDVVTDPEREWSGFCGKCTREDVSSLYNKQQMYMYCGHGTGVAFLSPRRFERIDNAPVTLLMGCSSAKPDNLGADDEESNSAAIDFIIRGAPGVVGTLWDVSDGEIDRYTLSLLTLWAGATLQGQDAEFVSLAEAVARSRSACRTPYLVGAACVVLGAPDIRVKPRT